MRTVYRTYVEGELYYTGNSLSDAIRTWDAKTYLLGRSVSGGVAVAAYDEDDNWVRDGWILHVREDGVAYMNPHLADTVAS